MSDSVRPHRRQPTRLPRPWDSPGKNTGVGCHFLLQCTNVPLIITLPSRWVFWAILRKILWLNEKEFFVYSNYLDVKKKKIPLQLVYSYRHKHLNLLLVFIWYPGNLKRRISLFQGYADKVKLRSLKYIVSWWVSKTSLSEHYPSPPVNPYF